MHSITDILLVAAAIVAAAVYLYRRLKPGKTAECGGCSQCESAAPAGTPAAKPAAEIRVPVSSIGHRQP